MTFTTSTDQTSTVTNTGTIALVAESFSVTMSKPATGSPHLQALRVHHGLVGEQVLGGAGTQIGGTLANNTTTTVTASVSLAVSGILYLQVEPTGVTSSTKVTISTLVTSPTQLRAAVKTNQ